MFHIVLYQPEIPPNTGNIMRLCVNAGARLHLIHPLGFSVQEKAVRRAGLDYRDLVCVREYGNYDAFTNDARPSRLFACSTKGTSYYHQHHYEDGDFFMFGSETRGLPQPILESLTAIAIPMRSNSRCLNLSNAVAIMLYEASRQVDFLGM